MGGGGGGLHPSPWIVQIPADPDIRQRPMRKLQALNRRELLLQHIRRSLTRRKRHRPNTKLYLADIKHHAIDKPSRKKRPIQRRPTLQQQAPYLPLLQYLKHRNQINLP